MEGAEGLAFEAHALGGTPQTNRCLDLTNLDVSEAGVDEQLLEHGGVAEAERPGLPGKGGAGAAPGAG